MKFDCRAVQGTHDPVVLVGCGPGASDLLTLRALARIKKADVLVVDRLVGEEILQYAPKEAQIHFVGKDPRGSTTPQDLINQLLVREALKGLRVVRLKGGDGFVFGRAAEEIRALRAAGLEVEIVPGITAAHACAASIVLPLTLRESIRQFSLITGAIASGVDREALDWATLVQKNHAFAIYMGVRNAHLIRQCLLHAGASPSLRIVIVENGSCINEMSIATTLEDVEDALKVFDIKGPAILFGGLDWEDANLTMPHKVHVYRPSSKLLRESLSQDNSMNNI